MLYDYIRTLRVKLTEKIVIDRVKLCRLTDLGLLAEKALANWK